jgi:channel protein (hemolysin III family)
MDILHKELQFFKECHPTYGNGESRPKYRGLSHLISFYTIPYIFLYVQYQYVTSTLGLISSYITMSGMLCLFGISSHYHRTTQTKEQHDLLLRLDHSSIVYFIGAGMYSFCFLLLKTYPLQGYLFITLNSISLFIGIVYQMTKHLTNRQTLTSILITCCQPATLFPFIFYIYPLLTRTEIFFISCKYLLQAFGLIIYKYKLFDCNKDVFGHHEVFHLVHIAGTITTFGFLPTICARI